ncbi:hypothetical protein IP92_02063 [Pseudoduganella flava]|uniref:Uncharacterized protein n=1 Tax=Pseudoduganella flava TaxID=871742 RepID=A0A562PW45_9BURK|nr:hypothetical protein [Pseudoduganella flava]QGZ39758.1 hypothetical protein GO485_12320 [Pseudoduganella flava]TWI48671.1 hypothetical protein IP92_02063 [Pseudoduganella flava]
MRPAPYLLALLLLALLAGCSLPYRPPQFIETDTKFPGLIDFVAQAPDRKADVLLVHGMCTHDARWATDTVATLAKQLAANVQARPSVRGTAPEIAPYIEIVPLDVVTPQGTLRFQSLIWSPLTTPVKQQLCYDQTHKSPICTGAPPFPYTRAKFNGKVKDWLLDDCLPDALAYQGVARDQIQLRMRNAILRTMGDRDDGAPLVVISESLGSKILFDTLLRMTQEGPESRAAQVAEREVRRMAWLIMAANQIPLLQVADQPLATQAPLAAQAAPPDSLQQLLQMRRMPAPASRRAATPLTLVAFSDPSDVLTYTLPPERYREAGAVVYNVLVSTAPTYFGFIQDPVRAHEDYLVNPDVGSLIACGVPRSDKCK